MKDKWSLMYVALALVLLFSLFAVPRIATRALDKTKGQIITIAE